VAEGGVEAGPSVEELLRRLGAAVGAEQMKLICQNLELWERNGAHALIEQWRRRQVEAMYCLRMQAVQNGFASSSAAVAA